VKLIIALLVQEVKTLSGIVKISSKRLITNDKSTHDRYCPRHCCKILHAFRHSSMVAKAVLNTAQTVRPETT
jgi:hypothetical protein